MPRHRQKNSHWTRSSEYACVTLNTTTTEWPMGLSQDLGSDFCPLFFGSKLLSDYGREVGNGYHLTARY